MVENESGQEEAFAEEKGAESMNKTIRISEIVVMSLEVLQQP